MRLVDADYLLSLPFHKMIHTDFGETGVPVEEIENAPTITPAKGHWCEMDLCSGSTFQCSECGGEIKTYYKPKFCEFCGADMRGGEKNVS